MNNFNFFYPPDSFEDVMCNLREIQRNLSSSLQKLKNSDSRTDMKMKLLETLKEIEAQYDEQASAQRKELEDIAMGGSGGGEGGAEKAVMEKKKKIDEMGKEKVDVEKNVCRGFSFYFLHAHVLAIFLSFFSLSLFFILFLTHSRSQTSRLFLTNSSTRLSTVRKN